MDHCFQVVWNKKKVQKLLQVSSTVWSGCCDPHSDYKYKLPRLPISAKSASKLKCKTYVGMALTSGQKLQATPLHTYYVNGQLEIC